MPVQPEAATVERLRGEVPELPGARIVRLRDELGSRPRRRSSPAGSTHCGRRRATPAPTPVAAANVIANQLVGAGVDPARVNPAELAKLVAARDEIPRKTFDDAIAHVGDDGFSADPYLEQKAVADTAELEPIVDEVLAANAATSRRTAPARRACSASSSVR